MSSTAMLGMASTVRRSGQRIRLTTVPTTMSLRMPLAKSPSARLENIFMKPRLKPTLGSLGRYCSVVAKLPLWLVPGARTDARMIAMGTSATLTFATEEERQSAEEGESGDGGGELGG